VDRPQRVVGAGQLVAVGLPLFGQGMVAARLGLGRQRVRIGGDDGRQRGRAERDPYRCHDFSPICHDVFPPKLPAAGPTGLVSMLQYGNHKLQLQLDKYNKVELIVQESEQ
jgi:hypothetical protein